MNVTDGHMHLASLLDLQAVRLSQVFMQEGRTGGQGDVGWLGGGGGAEYVVVVDEDDGGGGGGGGAL
jgi:hypothetical protein